MKTSQRLEQLTRSYVARFQLRGCDAVGPGARLEGRPRIVNAGSIRIGKRFRFSSLPVVSHLLAESGGRIDIGDDVSIGHGSGISARGLIRIGSGTRLGAFVLAMDTDYHVAGDASAEADIVPLEIGSDVSIGSHVTILRGSVIGDGAKVLDGSVVRGEVPAGHVVDGVPARSAATQRSPDANDDVDSRVQRVAQLTFRLTGKPELTDGPAQIAAWDSLGALSFILALEEEFGVAISEERMASVGSLADAVSVVASTSEGF